MFQPLFAIQTQCCRPHLYGGRVALRRIVTAPSHPALWGVGANPPFHFVPGVSFSSGKSGGVAGILGAPWEFVHMGGLFSLFVMMSLKEGSEEEGFPSRLCWMVDQRVSYPLGL